MKSICENEFIRSHSDTQIVDAMLPRVQELNAFVKIGVNKQNIRDLPNTFFEQYDIVVLSGGEEVRIRSGFP